MHRWLDRVRSRKQTALLAVGVPIALAIIDGGHLAALPAPPGPRGYRTQAQLAIETQPVCIGSTVRSAGALSDVLYYRAVSLGDGHVAVGYFAFFSEERPWGNNWMTWSVVPALAIDLFYSRTLLIAPGLQRALYGAGDVEGVRVLYETLADGSLRLDNARADDATHAPVSLSREEALALDAEPAHFLQRRMEPSARRTRRPIARRSLVCPLLRRGIDSAAARVGRARFSHRGQGASAAGSRRARRRTAARRRRRGQRPNASARLTMCGVMKMMSSPRASLA